jgi:hypothetical protein
MNAIRHLFAVLRDLVLELSDEGAYRRYLQRRGQPHSPEQWQRFTETRYRKKFGNAKCC